MSRRSISANLVRFFRSERDTCWCLPAVRWYNGRMLEAQHEVEAMLGDCCPFEQVEGVIDSLPVSDEQKAALWLLAWGEQDRRTRRRVALEALAQVGD